jgi:hypothetical protein
MAAIPVLLVVGEIRSNPPKIRKDFVLHAVLIFAPVAIAIISFARHAGVPL